MSFLGILVAVLIGLAVMAIFAGLLTVLSRDDDITDRMQNLVQSDLAVDTGGGQAMSSSSSKKALERLDSKLRARGLGQGITENLIQADLKLTVTEYVLLILSITFLGAVIGFAISRQPVSALVAGLISFFGLPAFVAWRRTKRRREFSNQLVDVLTQMTGALRAGYSIAQSLDVISKQVPAPAGYEFGRVVREAQLGQPMAVALDHLIERMYSDDLVMIVTAININQQIGGNLAEVLDTVAETIRERIRIQGEIRVLTAQQAISGYILTFLPIALGAILLIINPTYQMRLFTPGITLCIPITAGLGIVIGYFIMRRIVDIDV